MVVGLALVVAVTVYLPLLIRLVRLYVMERQLRGLSDYASPRDAKANKEVVHRDIRNLLGDSPIAGAYQEFERRWKTAVLTEGLDRAPIRLIDVLDERPLLPFGPRRSLLPVLPGLFLGVGVFGALSGLIPSLGSVTEDMLSGSAQSTWMVTQLGLALRATAWGFLCALVASVAGRLLEGAFSARGHALDQILEEAFGSVSPGELAEITRQTQQKSLDRLGKELSGFANELSQRLDRGLQRIEQSTARAANLVSQEQRGALHTVVQELSLSVRQGVEHHLSELRGALQRAIEHQTSVTGGLAETFERMVENSNTQDRVARTLADSATAVEKASHAMRDSTIEMQPILEHMSTTSQALSATAGHISDTQQVVARTAEGVRGALEHAAAGVDDQRQFIDLSLTEIRRSLAGLGDGLGESLQRALREVDDVLSVTVGQLRDTLAESNDTIDRLAGPIRAAEGTTRETHVALDRVRTEVEALGQWLNQAVKPLRGGLMDIDGRAEDIARTLNDFTNHTRQIDKTMEALRVEIHEESRRLQGTGSELGRRLQLASDAVGLLESTTSEAARRSRPETTPATRERTWSPAPRDRGVDSSTTTAPSAGSPTPPTHSTAPPTMPPTMPPTTPLRSEDGSGFRSPTSERAFHKRSDTDYAAPDIDRSSDHSDAEREARLPRGYRLGAPRAQGPDPYSRFENEPAPPSNVRHFPTRERELGDDLKLSGLLGPSGPLGADETRPDRPAPKAVDPQPSDDADETE
jgi:ABC-type transporter Mla subunit MlaD